MKLTFLRKFLELALTFTSTLVLTVLAVGLVSPRAWQVLIVPTAVLMFSLGRLMGGRPEGEILILSISMSVVLTVLARILAQPFDGSVGRTTLMFCLAATTLGYLSTTAPSVEVVVVLIVICLIAGLSTVVSYFPYAGSLALFTSLTAAIFSNLGAQKRWICIPFFPHRSFSRFP